MVALGIRLPVIVCTAAAVVGIAGCGGSSSADKKQAKPSPTSTSGAAQTMKDACPQVESAMPADPGPLVPRSDWSALYAKLGQLSRGGDLETKNALDPLRGAVDTYLKDPAQGQDSVDAWQALLAAVETLSDRCAAAGSSAFQ